MFLRRVAIRDILCVFSCVQPTLFSRLSWGSTDDQCRYRILSARRPTPVDLLRLANAGQRNIGKIAPKPSKSRRPGLVDAMRSTGTPDTSMRPESCTSRALLVPQAICGRPTHRRRVLVPENPRARWVPALPADSIPHTSRHSMLISQNGRMELF